MKNTQAIFNSTGLFVFSFLVEAGGVEPPSERKTS